VFKTTQKLSEFEEGLYILEFRKSEVKKLRQKCGIKDNKITAAICDTYDESYIWFTSDSDYSHKDAAYAIYWAWK